MAVVGGVRFLMSEVPLYQGMFGQLLATFPDQVPYQ